MDNKKLKIVIMTQSDRCFLPKNIKKTSHIADVSEVVQVNCKSSLNNKLTDYYNWFGLFQCAKMGVLTILYTAFDILAKLFKYKIFKGIYSVESISKANKLPFRVITDSNSPEFVEHIRKINPDLIISYSAPQVIKSELLNIPEHGVINVHGSLLPDYRGCLPSFWYLYNDEKVGGATVHYMSAKIDDGDIIVQGTVDISDCKTMFSLMKKTKLLGGELMIKAIEDISSNNVSTKPNDVENGSYFTWPTKEQAKEFLKKGYRLI